MDGLSTGIAVGGIVVNCIRAGQYIADKYKSYKNAERETSELILRLQGQWLRIKYQVTFVNRIWDTLEQDFQMHQINVLRVLHAKLQVAVDTVDSLIGDKNQGSSVKQLMVKKGDMKGLKYTARVKDDLKGTMEELRLWQETFNLAWFLMLRMSSQSLNDSNDESTLVASDNRLPSLKNLKDTIKSNLDSSKDDIATSSIFIQDSFPHQQPIVFCSGAAVTPLDMATGQTLMLDTVPQDVDNDSRAIKRDIRNIARILEKIEPVTFGLLNCQGVSQSQVGQETVYRFVFVLPTDYQNPRCLRDLLISKEPYTLNQRLQIARQLSKAVMLVHATQFVHKNIRPDAIIILEQKDDLAMKWPFLVGFESFRVAEGKTAHIGDISWERNLYRHPERQGLRPEEDYVMQHDIYSLGVCLLEIGLWTSFLLWSNGHFTPMTGFDVDTCGDLKEHRKRAVGSKKNMIKLAREKLPLSMGNMYAEVVISCLTCLDKSENSFGDEKEFLDEDGIQIGIRYIEKIWTSIQKINI